jgi:hypothetical protein
VKWPFASRTAGLAVSALALALSCDGAQPGAALGADGGVLAGGDDGPDQPPPAERCEAYATTFCDRWAACAPRALEFTFGDVGTCQQRSRLSCVLAASASGSGITAAAAMACASALASASCDDVVDDMLPACRFTGRLAIDGACGSHSQCGSGYCHIPDGDTCGLCAERGAEGAECASDEACLPSLLCSEVGRCVPAAMDGDFCNERRPCRRVSLYCGGVDRTCHRPRGEGESCNFIGPGAFAPCDVGLSCRRSSEGARCVRVQYSVVGEECGASLVSCGGSASCLAGTCQAPGTDGGRCTLSPFGDGPGCLFPASCSSGTCALPDFARCQ